MKNSLSALFRSAAILFALLFAAHAWGQAHEKQIDNYVIQSSAVGSENLSAETARAQGIQRIPTLAVINVTVMEKNGDGERIC